jgi:hypothetical protein
MNAPSSENFFGVSFPPQISFCTIRGFNIPPCFDLWLATFHIVERLYDPPYPETPQTDRVEKTERNAEIIARYEAGETGACLAEAFGISEQRVNQVVRGKRK